MPFRFVVTNTAGTALGELRNASNRRVGLGINRNPTAAATIRLDNPLADTLLNGASRLKVYETGSPFSTPIMHFHGDVASAEEVGVGDGGPGSLAFTFAGPMTRLAERLIGKDATGYTSGTALAPRDRSLLVADVLAAANAVAYTGVTLGTVTNVGSTSFLAYSPYKVAGEAITELVNTLDGPDYEVVAVEPVADSGGVRIALLNVKGAVGQARPAAVFEYGTGRRNVVNYRRQVSYGILNAGYILPSSANPAGTVVAASDATSIATYGRREGLVAGDLAVDLLRQRLVDEHVRVRKQPRQIITFEPTRDDPARPGRVPRFGVDYFLGDAVPFRAVARTQNAAGAIVDTTRVNASLRVYGIDWSIDELGAATPTLTLTAD